MKPDFKQTLLSLIALLMVSCSSSYEPPIVNIPEPLEEIKTVDSGSNTDGSLWPGEDKSMFADHKAKNVGDLVTITIQEQASASKEASTDTSRTTAMSAGIPNFFGIENSGFVEKHSGIDLSTLVKADFDNSFKGSGKTVRKEDLVASLTTQVIKIYPNGNFKIRGGKEVMVNSEVQIIYLTGIIRPVDINAANTVDSKNVLNARISYTGKGAISDKQKPGWVMRALDNIWPF